MRYLKGGLEEYQAFFGVFEIDTPAIVLLHDHFVVLFRLVTKKRQLETTLPVERAVAASAVTADFCEDRHHVGIKAGRRRCIRALDQRGGRSAEAPVRCANDGSAIS